MITFQNLPLAPGTLLSLSKIDIDFMFQPIFRRETGELFAYEAILGNSQSEAMSIVDEYESNTKLHILELATIFGAVKRFSERGFREKLCINSFASESLEPNEIQVFMNSIPNDMHGRIIFELINHNYYSPLTWQMKRNQLRSQGIKITLDDCSMNYEHIQAYNIFEPDYIKLDRSYVAGIATERYIQDKLSRTLEFYHSMGTKIMIEGIETEKEYNYIIRTSVDYIQGNYIAKPV